MCASARHIYVCIAHAMCASVMIPITPKRVALAVWLLENIEKEVSIYQATKEARVLNYHATHEAFKDFASAGYIQKTKAERYRVTDAPALVHQIALAFPFRLKPIVGFFLGGDMIGKMQRLSSIEPSTIFTLFAGAELLSPYIRTIMVHAYVPAKSIETQKDRLLQSGGRRAELNEADTFLLPTDHAFVFEFAKKIGSYRIPPMGVLLADLESYGGLAQEQAGRIMREWLSRPSAL